MNESRLARVRRNLEGLGLSQALFCDPLSIYYLTGYLTQPFERFFALLVREDGATLFCNRLFPDASGCGADVVAFDDTDDPLALLAERLDAGERLGVDKDLAARWLVPLIERGAVREVALASAAVDGARSIKDAEERELMRAASAMNDEAMGWLREQARSGKTELEIAEGLLGVYRELGAEGFSFEPIVSFGANAADPHHEPDATRGREGDVVLFDVGCLLDGYCSDMTRCFFLGEPDARAREVYELVRAANAAGRAAVAPGVPLAQIDAAARSVIADAGYGEFFTHRLGHQIGLSVHEPGDVSSANESPAREGMVFSIEPGIYLPGEVGVRIEDLMLVSADGGECLNGYPRELEML